MVMQSTETVAVKEERGALVANKKLWQLKLNLYSPGSGLTQLKVRESNSRG